MSAPQHLPEGPSDDEGTALPVSARLPRIGEHLRRPLQLVDRVFDRVYGSALNPLYQTGSLIVAMLLVMLVSGLYLFLLYDTARPYESMQAIQAQPLGRFLRSLHRYSADASIALVAVHAIRMFLQGRNWGARALAWLSGIVALGILLVCGWTGLVLVWDELALEVALRGAGVLDLLPIFPEPIASIFVSGSSVGASFFFTNLFLHLALPTGLLTALGVHVLRLARPQLFPPRRVLLTVVTALAALALVWPVALAPGAKLDELPGSLGMDWYFTFWLPLFASVGPAGTVSILGALGLLAASAIWWWRPGKVERPPPAYVDEPNCRGCSQCYEDCPYGAITMVPRSVGHGSEIVARVDPALCTSCGICTASCDVLRVGPPGRRGRDLLQIVKRYAAVRDLSDALIWVGCNHNPAAAGMELEGIRVERFPIECAGSLHLTSVRAFLKRGALGVVIASCTPRDCQFRHGPRWVRARLDEARHPGLPQGADRERVLLLSHSEGELDEARVALKDFVARVAPFMSSVSEVTKRTPTALRVAGRWLLRGVVSFAIVSALAAPRLLRAGAEPNEGVLRLAFSDVGAKVDVCREISDSEREAMPVHMRTLDQRQCRRSFLDHHLRVTVDGRTLIDKRVEAGGARHDRPARVLEQVSLAPGPHEVSVEYVPLVQGVPDGDAAGVRELRLEQRLSVVAGRIHRVSYSAADARLVMPGERVAP